ncbi:hypothetical protein BH23ACT9_BH23ACT9_02010 [soil metagenome]
MAAGALLTVAAVALTLLAPPFGALLIPFAAVAFFLAGRAQPPLVAEVDHEAPSTLPTLRQFVVATERLFAGGVGHPAVLIIDLERFRDVETVLGDDRALGVLHEVGKRVAATAEGWPVGSSGGERFAAAMMARPFMPAHASSIGMALGEGSADSLLRRASIAAVGASTEQSGLEVHRLEEPAVVHRRLAVASALTDAMEQPLAEQTGLVGPLLSVVLSTSFAACVRWRAAGLAIPVSVNLSALNLRQPLLVSELTAALDAAGLSPQDVNLEVTETAIITDQTVTERTLLELRAVGFRVALDDFGVGHSSLAGCRSCRSPGSSSTSHSPSACRLTSGPSRSCRRP